MYILYHFCLCVFMCNCISLELLRIRRPTYYHYKIDKHQCRNVYQLYSKNVVSGASCERHWYDTSAKLVLVVSCSNATPICLNTLLAPETFFFTSAGIYQWYSSLKSCHKLYLCIPHISSFKPMYFTSWTPPCDLTSWAYPHDSSHDPRFTHTP